GGGPALCDARRSRPGRAAAEPPGLGAGGAPGQPRALRRALGAHGPTARGCPGAPTSLFVATSAFDREHMDFVAVPSEAPQLERLARSFALGDFDGDGVLDVAVGAPDDGATDEVGGQFRVWRRDDAGRLLPWGRYRQS